MRFVNNIKIDVNDNVTTVCEDAIKGDVLVVNVEKITLLQDCSACDKVALENLKEGSEIIKYNGVIGTCTQPVQKGEWVHKHNLISNYMKDGGDNHA